MQLIAIDRDLPESYLFTEEAPPHTDLTLAVIVTTAPEAASGKIPVGSILRHMPGVWDYPTESEMERLPWKLFADYPTSEQPPET